MTRVLLIGLKPDAVDYNDPDLPPGVSAQVIADGIAATLAQMRDMGWEAEFCALENASGDDATIAGLLAPGWDCIVIGGGIRLPRRNLELFERVLNAVHRGAPDTPIAFNTMPTNTVEAVQRWLPGPADGS